MTDILLERDVNQNGQWDIVLTGGDLSLTADTSRLAEVAQRVVYALHTWIGESVYDLDAGVPYEEAIFGDEPAPAVVGFMRNVVESTEGVDEVLDTSFILDDNRNLSISCTIRVGEDFDTFALEVRPV